MTVELAFTRTVGRPDAPPVVLLGSLGSNRSMWDPQVHALAIDHDVIAVDLRGHGESPAPRGPYTVDALADDVCALLERLSLHDAHLVGLSLGGAIAQRIAARRPTRVQTLTLLCTAARFGAPQSWLDRATAVRQAGTESIADAVVGRWFTPALRAANPDLVRRARAMITQTDAEGYAGCCEALADWDGRADLAAIVAPTLVIAGAQDPATPTADLDTIARSIRGADLHVVESAAHLANMEQPHTVTQLITAHVAAAPRPRSPVTEGDEPG